MPNQYQHPSFEDRLMPVTESGCLMWLGAVLPSGHGQISVNGKSMGVHRYAWELKNGKIPKGLCVCHKCDVPSCVNTDHLFLGTRGENTLDMVRKGRHRPPKGVQNTRRGFTEKDIKNIIISKEHPQILADKYGVHLSHIYRIKKREQWKHVHLELEKPNA